MQSVLTLSWDPEIASFYQRSKHNPVQYKEGIEVTILNDFKGLSLNSINELNSSLEKIANESILLGEDHKNVREAKERNEELKEHEQKALGSMTSFYTGKLTTKESAEGYAAQLLYILLGTRNNTNVTHYVEEDISYSKPAYYDSETKNKKILNITNTTISSARSLKSALESIVEKWFIQPRNETVNGCDYWQGFFGTSNNLWSHSSYKKANPAETAMQLAYDLEKGMRNNTWSIWFFPGYITAYDVSPKAEKIIKEMNLILKQNPKLEEGKIPGIIAALRDCAEIYQKL